MEATPPSAELLSRLNAILEEYLGVNDDQLALQMAELAQQTDSFALLTEKIRATDLAVFQVIILYCVLLINRYIYVFEKKT